MSLARPVGALHGVLILPRRVEALARAIAPLLPPGRILDLGCGDGSLARRLQAVRPDIRVVGLEVHLRLRAPLPASLYDGRNFPFPKKTFPGVVIADSLHHAADPTAVLRECLRVADPCVVIKDHFCENAWERHVLRALDWGATPRTGWRCAMPTSAGRRGPIWSAGSRRWRRPAWSRCLDNIRVLFNRGWGWGYNSWPGSRRRRMGDE